MMRLLFFFFISLVLGYLFLQGSLLDQSTEKPIFLQVDEVAQAHQTEMEVFVHSRYQPSRLELEALESDYSNLWAHLNLLYATNDITAGKEYYTEGWFKQLAKQYEGPVEAVASRTDEQHELHILNWASDGLVCTAIDSNVVLRYTYPDQALKTSTVNLAVVLLYQGDHWRIDALKVLSETID